MANINSLQIKVSSEGITKAARDLDALGKSAESTEKKVLKLVQSVEDMVKKFSASSSHVKAMTDALNAVNRSTAASDAAMKSLAQSVNTLSTNIGKMSTGMQQGSSIVRTSTVNIQHHTAAMTDAHAAARGLTGSLGALWLTYGNLAPLAAGAAIGASMKAIISIGVDVEHVLENIRIKGENSTESMMEMRKAISDLGQGVYGPQEVVKALESLTLAGLKASDAVKAIGAAQNLALVGGTDINNAAEALVTIGTAVGATSKEYDYLADGISKAANISLASVDSIAQAVKRASVVNKLYGASFEDILTQTAALAQLGIKNSAAGTAITNFYANAMGSTEKAKKALNELGFSFQDATGKAKPLVEAYEEFTQKLNKFDLASQKKIITEIFGERALRDVEGLRDLVNQAAISTEKLADGTLKYKNRLQEVQDQIKQSAGTSALQAAEMSLTTENQIKSMINTLKSSFSSAFVEIEPEVRGIVKSLKEAFGSEEFKTAISNMASAFVNLASAVTNNIKPLTAIAEAFLIVASATAGGALFARMIPLVTGLIVGVTGLATSFTALGTAANIGAAGITAVSAASRLLPGIGVVLAGVTTAVMLYQMHTEKAADSTQKLAEEKRKAAEESGKDFIKALEDEASRLKKVNAELEKGVSLNQANAAATQAMAMVKYMEKFQEATSAAHEELILAQDAYNKGFKKNAFAAKDELKNFDLTKRLNEAEERVKKSLEASNQARSRALGLTKEIIDMNQTASDRMVANQKKADELAASKAGSSTFNPDAEKNAKKQLTFLENERLELQKVAAGYNAKTEALLKSFSQGEKVMADSQQAIIEVNKLENKYANDRIFNSQMALAKAADEAKFQHEKTRDLVEFGMKLKGVIEGEKEYQTSQDKTIGHLTRQAEWFIKTLKLTGDQADMFRELAKSADEVNKVMDVRNKLESQTKGSATRAEDLMAQAKAMSEYGSKAKSTALDLAIATVNQIQYNDAATEGEKKNYLAAAAFETVAKALGNITKIGQQSAEDMIKAEEDSLLMFADSEKKKLEIKAETSKKIIRMNQEQALSAALAHGDQRSWDAYERIAEESLRAIEQIDKTTKFKMHNVELQDWKKTVDNIVDVGLDGFNSLFDKGTSIWKSLTNSIKNMFKSVVIDFIKKEFAKPILLNIVAGVSGSLGMSGISNTANSMLGNTGGNGIGNIFSAGKSVFDLISGGFDKIGDSFANMTQWVMNKTGLGQQMVFGNSPFAQQAGGFMQGATIALLGNAIGKAISGGYSIGGGSGNSLVNIGSAAGAFFGGPIGSAIGAAIGGGLNRLFGMKAKETTAAGFSGSVSASGATGVNYTDWFQKGGLFRSNKSGRETTALSSDVQNTLTSGFKSVQLMSETFAKSLGVSSNALEGFTKSFDISLSKDDLKKQSGESDADFAKRVESKQIELVSKFFTDLGDEFATKLVPAISQFSRQGETAGQTLERLAGVFEATNKVAELLGKDIEIAFGSIGVASAAARDRLVELAGGAQNLVSNTSAYVNAIYSDSEKLEPVQKALSKAFQELGVSGIETKAQFKSLVDGLDVTTEQGAKMFSSLIQIAPAFAEVVAAQDAVAEAAKEVVKAEQERMKSLLSIQSQIAVLEKNEHAQGIIKQKQREIELAALEDSLRPWQERLYFLEDEAEKIEKSNSLQKSRLSIESEIAKLQDNQGAAAKILYQQRILELSTMEDSLQPLQRRLYQLQDEASLTEKLNNAHKQGLSMALSIAEYDKDEETRTKLLAEQRSLELAAMDASLRPLQERLNAIEDEKRVYDKAVEAAENAYSKLQAAIEKEKDVITKKYEDQINIVKEASNIQEKMIKASFDAQIKAAKKSAEDRIKAIKDVTKTEIAQAKASQDVAKESLNAIKSIFDAIENAIGSTKIESIAMDKARRQSAQSLLASAAKTGGDVRSVAGLSGALEDISNPSTSFFKTFEEYAVDQAMAKDSLESIKENAQSQIDYQQLTIDKLDATIETIQTNADFQIEKIQNQTEVLVENLQLQSEAAQQALQSATDQQIAQLESDKLAAIAKQDEVLQVARSQIDALKGIDVSVLGVREAITSLATAISNIKIPVPQPVINIPSPASGTSGGILQQGISGLYQNLLDRDPDQAGLDYWTLSALQNGLSLTDIAASMANSSEFMSKLPHFDVGSNYIPKDMVAVVHEGERIVPAADNAEIMRRIDNTGRGEMSKGEVVVILNEIKSAIMAGDISIAQKLSEILKIEKRWDTDGLPKERSV